MAAPRATWCACVARCVAAAVSLACAALIAGCASTVPVAEQTLRAMPKAWIALVPRGVAASEEFKRLVAARSREFRVTIVEFDPATGTPEGSLALVAAAMDAAGRIGAPNRVLGYVFIVGSPAVVAMGPWNFEGVRDSFVTDFPLGAGLDTSGESISADEWRRALEAEPRWIVGRLPYDDPVVVQAALAATLAPLGSAAEGPGKALVGAGSAPEAWAMSTVRARLRDERWQAMQVGPGGSSDQQALDGLLPVWNEYAPQLVVFAASPVEGSSAGGLNVLLRRPASESPENGIGPALVVACASEFGAPGNETMRSLFNKRWTAGAIGFTGPVMPFPIRSSVQLAVWLPCDLARGVPLGVAAEAERRRYWGLAARDLGMVVPGTSRWRSNLALSMVVLGDPAVGAAGYAAAPAQPANAPVVIAKPAAAAAEPTADAPASTASVEWPKWVALGALLAFFVAFTFWLTTRRPSGPAA